MVGTDRGMLYRERCVSVWSVQREVWSVQREVWSVQREVWSVQTEVCGMEKCNNTFCLINVLIIRSFS